MHATGSRCAALLAIAGLAVVPAIAAAQGKPVVTDIVSTQEAGIGVEYRKAVADAYAAINREHDLVRGGTLLAPVLAYCDEQQRPDRIAVSVSDAAEYKRFLVEHGDGTPVEWIDYACPAAYKAEAFRQVELGDYEAALPWLDKAVAIAPYWPDALSERGFVLNQRGKAAEALESYRKALALAEAAAQSYGSSRAIALRGIGYSLVELGDLAGARAAYERSLEVDPGNKTALKELDYIAGLEHPADKSDGGSGTATPGN
jgi:tetratricopeptide (TPR) repeat protein